MPKGIGILPGYRPSFIDHLVPLCQILNIPILITDQSIHQQIEFFYPPMEIILSEPTDYCLDETLVNFDFFVYADHCRRAHGGFQFGEYFTRHRARSVYTMHGNSDKNRHIYWIEKLEDEDIILAYGQQTIDFMQDKGVSKIPIICGNYRLAHYLQHRDFFDSKIAFPKEKKTILYAPTWSSPNLKSELRFDYTSFFEAHQAIFNSIPHEYTLIVKPHPHHIYLMSDELKEIEEKNPNILFLNSIPLIYPLLNQIDIYLGDYSSVGYDFLYFNRPMFFLNAKPETPYLHRCGIPIPKDFEDLCTVNENLSDVRKKTYDYAFSYKDPKQLKREIHDACTSTS